MSQDPLVIFTPSGKRGHVAPGTTVLAAARQLGVDLDSVCGGRGICSKCQITPGFGEFPKHGLTVGADALSAWNAVEERYDRVRGLPEGRRLGCQAKYLTSVCTGSLILAAAGFLKGKRAACHWAWRDLLIPFGAIVDDSRVARDGDIITGGGVTAGLDFAFVLMAELAGETLAKSVRDNIVINTYLNLFSSFLIQPFFSSSFK